MELGLIIFISVFLLAFGGFFLYIILRLLKGRVTIILPKSNLAEGETISGTLQVKVRKPIIANQILVGVSMRSRSRRAGSMHSGNGSMTVMFENAVKTNYQLNPGVNIVPFSFQVPPGITKGTSFGNHLADAAMTFLGGRVHWYVHSRVDCKGVDLYKKVPVYISSQSQAPVMTAA